jgi:hypothetical protein
VPSAARSPKVQDEGGGAAAMLRALGLGPKNSGWLLPGLVKPRSPCAADGSPGCAVGGVGGALWMVCGHAVEIGWVVGGATLGGGRAIEAQCRCHCKALVFKSNPRSSHHCKGAPRVVERCGLRRGGIAPELRQAVGRHQLAAEHACGGCSQGHSAAGHLGRVQAAPHQLQASGAGMCTGLGCCHWPVRPGASHWQCPCIAG